SGNSVMLLRDGPAAFSEMIHLIDRAKQSVDLEVYIFRSDEVGEQMAEALMRAAVRGVAVRLLVDWIGTRGTSRKLFKRLRHSGIEVAVFSPPGFRRWFGLVPRDHRKLLVVDGHVGITGGFGVGREWTTGIQKVHRSRWRDTAVRIEGDAA